MDGNQGVGRRTRAVLLDRGPVVALGVFSLIAVAGYAVFGRDPSRVVELSPSAARFYGISFGFFAQAQILLAGLVLAVHLFRKAGTRWLAAFGAVYVLSLGSELMGTAFGVPFGPYSYTELLGVKWLGLVPALIPLSWFFMAVPAYGLAAVASRGGGSGAGSSRALGRAVSKVASRSGSSSRSGPPSGSWAEGWVSRVFLGSLLLLAWDLTLDPAMSEVTRYWVWGDPGPYYGMPLMNLVGWYVTGVVLMAALEWLGARRWLAGVSPGWQAGFYAANLILPLGMTLAAGFWGAAVATALVLGGVVVWASSRSRSLAVGEERREAVPVRREASSGAEVGR